ncbi:MAG: Asp23/Gls24 family envelope stress response protein [Eubacterium sp.]|nr:Asp23/Gls24 family envelope stress response protein [Eubacterium sp.]
MDGQRNTYKIYDHSELGEVHISDDVLAVISAMAATEVDGVLAMAGNITSELISKLGMKKLSKGVHVDVAENTVMVDLSIILKMNVNILAVSKKIQDRVKSTLENMTGMEVANVNVYISSVASN